MSDTTELAKTGVDLVEKYADRFSEIISQYSGPAADLAIGVGRIAAIQEIVVGVGAAGISIICAKACLWFAKKAIAGYASEVPKKSYDQNDAVYVVPAMATIGTAVPTIIFAQFAFGKLTNVFAWAGIFKPVVYLAAKALSL